MGQWWMFRKSNPVKGCARSKMDLSLVNLNGMTLNLALHGTPYAYREEQHIPATHLNLLNNRELDFSASGREMYTIMTCVLWTHTIFWKGPFPRRDLSRKREKL